MAEPLYACVDQGGSIRFWSAPGPNIDCIRHYTRWLEPHEEVDAAESPYAFRERVLRLEWWHTLYAHLIGSEPLIVGCARQQELA